MKNVFFDTDIPLNKILQEKLTEYERHEKKFNNLESLGYLTTTLITRGNLESFWVCNDEIYVYNPDLFQNRPITIEIKMYLPEVLRDENGKIKTLPESERQKIAKGRRFIARWIYKSPRITDNEYKDFSKVHLIGISFLLSIPHFLFDQFEKEIQQTGMKYKMISPDKKNIICVSCQHNFVSKQKRLSIYTCPQCGEKNAV